MRLNRSLVDGNRQILLLTADQSRGVRTQPSQDAGMLGWPASDGAAAQGPLDYYHALRAQRWTGDLALHLEREFFGQDALGAIGPQRGNRGRLSAEEPVRRLADQLMPLLDRANGMVIRNLKAIKELRQGLVPAIAIGRAEQVTVNHPQNGRAHLRPVNRTFKPHTQDSAG